MRYQHAGVTTVALVCATIFLELHAVRDDALQISGKSDGFPHFWSKEYKDTWIDQACPEKHYCLPDSEAVANGDRKKWVLRTPVCPGRCVSCNLDPVSWPPGDGEEMEMRGNDMDTEGFCSKCTFDTTIKGASCYNCEPIDKDDDSAIVLLRSPQGRQRCYKRPKLLEGGGKTLPGLCSGATQGVNENDDLVPVSLGELWGIRKPGTHTFIQAPVRLQPTSSRCETGCEVYLAVFNPAESITNESMTLWAGSQRKAAETYMFTIRRADTSIAGTKATAAFAYDYGRAAIVSNNCPGCIFSLHDERHGYEDWVQLKFQSRVTDIDFQEIPVESLPTFKLSKDAQSALAMCLEFMLYARWPDGTYAVEQPPSTSKNLTAELLDVTKKHFAVRNKRIQEEAKMRPQVGFARI